MNLFRLPEGGVGLRSALPSKESEESELLERPANDGGREAGEFYCVGEPESSPASDCHQPKAGFWDAAVGAAFDDREDFGRNFVRLEEDEETFEELPELLSDSGGGFGSGDVADFVGIGIAGDRGSSEGDVGGFAGNLVSDGERKSQTLVERDRGEGCAHRSAELLPHFVGSLGVPEGSLADLKRIDGGHLPIEEPFAESYLGGDFFFEIRSGAGDDGDFAFPVDFDAASESLFPTSVVNRSQLAEDFSADSRVLSKDRGEIGDDQQVMGFFVEVLEHSEAGGRVLSRNVAGGKGSGGERVYLVDVRKSQQAFRHRGFAATGGAD